MEVHSLNTKENLIILKGDDKTREIKSCKYNHYTKKYDVIFYNNPKQFNYGYNNVIWYRNPNIISPSAVKIKYNGKLLYNMKYISVFNNVYWHIIFENDWEETYHISQLKVEYSCLLNNDSKNVFDYLKLIAEEISVKTEDDTKILKNQYDKMEQYLGEKSAAAKYINPADINHIDDNALIIFPFGSNSSQTKAVTRALKNDLSVIEGPPGTGKTQTILNIIANLIIRGKTIEVVSNNNSATENVYEKLCKYGYGFLVAPLGKSKNREKFIEEQTGKIPDLSLWDISFKNQIEVKNKVFELSEQLFNVFNNQQELSKLKQELYDIKTEQVYFDDFYNDNEENFVSPKTHVKSNDLLNLWIRLDYKNSKNTMTVLNKIIFSYCFGLKNRKYLKIDISTIIHLVKQCYYKLKINELEIKINNIEKNLENANSEKSLNDYVELSRIYFKKHLYDRYGTVSERMIFEIDDLWKNQEEFIKEYPIILSTTYSSRSSLPNYTYDYIIMDEASQVDVATGALALSVAKNAVIVGDRKQLPNVVTEVDKQKTDKIFALFKINNAYNFSQNSFLASVCKLFPDIPNTLLREHYRCHPKIINFCNKKFYNDELIIMTEDHNEDDVLKVYKTVKGNHARGHINQRQIDEIVQNILPELNNKNQQEVGIIAPYRDQVEKISADINNHQMLIDTVHKFQGREIKDIIMSTVDDEVTSFSDDANLLNVAVSRAIKRFRIVVNPNEKNKFTNVGDFVNYVEYNNFEIVESEIRSIFDYLYKQYWSEKEKILENGKRVSVFESENLMYNLIREVLLENNYTDLGVVTHLPLKEIFKNLNKLNDEEKHFVSKRSSHIDFMIYSKVSKMPILAIEVDGYDYHKKGTKQFDRDIIKDAIFKKYNLPLERFKTNGSGEKEKIEDLLNKIRQNL